MSDLHLEKREFERFDLAVPATLNWLDESAGELSRLATTDVCAGGAYFKASQGPAQGTEVHVELRLSVERLREIFELDQDQVLIKIKGKVLRTDPEGFVVRFEKEYEMGGGI